MLAANAILDVGKTHAKLTLVSAEGVILRTRLRANQTIERDGTTYLDADGIEAWLIDSLSDCASDYAIEAIVPVAHGATAALISNDTLAAPVLDYECDPPSTVVRDYDRERDPFTRTLSPRLPHGLNLGVQLAWQERLTPALREARICLWPQYWAWRLSLTHAAEVTSLGCHTDLWLPRDNQFSALSQRHGWSERLGAITKAGDILSHVRSDIAHRTGLSRQCAIYCGLHDSNAALLGARGYAQTRDHPFVLLTTGTWFVAMQCGADSTTDLDETRDMLANVDVQGRVVPSARFMGGREYEIILDGDFESAPSVAAVQALVARRTMAFPTFVGGCGPYPQDIGVVCGTIHDTAERAALAALYLALMSDAMLAALNAKGPILLEGRFAQNMVFAAALAALRPTLGVYCLPDADGIVLGAISLRFPHFTPPIGLTPVMPLDADLIAYRDVWRRRKDEIR